MELQQLTFAISLKVSTLVLTSEALTVVLALNSEVLALALSVKLVVLTTRPQMCPLRLILSSASLRRRKSGGSRLISKVYIQLYWSDCLTVLLCRWVYSLSHLCPSRLSLMSAELNTSFQLQALVEFLAYCSRQLPQLQVSSFPTTVDYIIPSIFSMRPNSPSMPFDAICNRRIANLNNLWLSIFSRILHIIFSLMTYWSNFWFIWWKLHNSLFSELPNTSADNCSNFSQSASKWNFIFCKSILATKSKQGTLF